jgi:hypothetical protein
MDSKFFDFLNTEKYLWVRLGKATAFDSESDAVQAMILLNHLPDANTEVVDENSAYLLSVLRS